MATSHRSGPGRWTADGSPVELHRLLRPQGEPEIIQGVLPRGATILELGCGVGRITHPLLQMGFSVVAVDNSEEMLQFVEGAEKVRADIETLDLGRRFDAVLLMSHLIDKPERALRRALLETCRRHIGEDGIVIIERHSPEWVDTVEIGSLGNSLGVDTFLEHVERRGAEIDMTIRWKADERTWTLSFTVERLDKQELKASLTAAGLSFVRWLDGRRTVFSARSTPTTTFNAIRS